MNKFGFHFVVIFSLLYACHLSASFAPPAQTRNTPLHIQTALGNEEIVYQLLTAQANPNAQDVNGHTPLHIANRVGNVSIIQALEAHGANQSIEDNRGWTPHMTAPCYFNESGEAYSLF